MTIEELAAMTKACPDCGGEGVIYSGVEYPCPKCRRDNLLIGDAGRLIGSGQVPLIPGLRRECDHRGQRELFPEGGWQCRRCEVRGALWRVCPDLHGWVLVSEAEVTVVLLEWLMRAGNVLDMEILQETYCVIWGQDYDGGTERGPTLNDALVDAVGKAIGGKDEIKH